MQTDHTNSLQGLSRPPIIRTYPASNAIPGQKRVKVGVIDSGMGGWGVIRELLPMVPEAEVISLADTQFGPYGQMGAEKMISRLHSLVELLLAYEVKVVVLACHTATCWAIEDLRKSFPALTFVGVEPFIKGQVPFAARFRARGSEGKKWGGGKILVLLTPSTAQSPWFKAQRKRWDPHGRIQVAPQRKLAWVIEKNFHLKGREELRWLLQESLEGVGERPLGRYSRIILGCTHYWLVGEEISQIFGAPVVSTGPYVAQRCRFLLSQMASQTIH